jgi:peroxidase
VCESSYGSGNVVTCNELELTELPKLLSSESVKSFDVSINVLRDIKELIFKDYPLLETLSLSENTIEWIDSRAFFGLKMLKNIDLSHNNLRSINVTMFSDTPLLQTVSFSGNPLVYSPDLSPILASSSIMSLDLSYCSLTSVNLRTFSQLPSLQVLDLNSNNLREFNRDILNTLTKIAVIDLRNNRWNCDCNIVDVLNWLSERRRSNGLLGEQKPVKCVEEGILETIWTAASKNKFCTGQPGISSEASASKNPPKILESKIQTQASTEPLTILQPKEEKKEISMLESARDKLLSSNSNALLFFCILFLIVGLTTFVTIVAVIYFTDFLKSPRKKKMSPVLKNSIGSYKNYLFSKIPLTSSSISSAVLTEKRFSASGVSTGGGSYTSNSDHIYERIE